MFSLFTGHTPNGTIVFELFSLFTQDTHQVSLVLWNGGTRGIHTNNTSVLYCSQGTYHTYNIYYICMYVCTYVRVIYKAYIRMYVRTYVYTICNTVNPEILTVI